MFRGDLFVGWTFFLRQSPTGNAQKIFGGLECFQAVEKTEVQKSCESKRNPGKDEAHGKLFEKISSAYLGDHPRTWKWFITLDRKSPITGVVGPLPNGLSWLINVGYQLLTNWDDPPSTVATVKRIIAFFRLLDFCSQLSLLFQRLKSVTSQHETVENPTRKTSTSPKKCTTELHNIEIGQTPKYAEPIKCCNLALLNTTHSNII